MTISDADFMAFKPMFDAIQLAIEKADCSERVVTIAAGLRMVADAIDPPPMVQAMQDVAETLARPKVRIPGHCMDDCRPAYHVSVSLSGSRCTTSAAVPTAMRRIQCQFILDRIRILRPSSWTVIGSGGAPPAGRLRI